MIRRSFVVKFQLALASTTRTNKALVYDELRTFTSEIPIPDKIRAIIKDKGGKAYFKCQLVGTMLDLIELVDDEEW